VPGEVSSGTGWHYDARGWVQVDGNGAVLEGLDIPFNVNVTADRVVIRNVRVRVSGESFGISLRSTEGVRISNTEVSGTDRRAGRVGAGIKDIYADSTGTVVSHVEVFHASTGIQLDAGTVEDCYIHTPGFVGDEHVNGTTSNSSAGVRLTLRHNTILNDQEQTDAVSLFQDFGPQSNRVIADNLLAGGAYALYAGAGTRTTTGIVVTGNRFARLYHSSGGTFGPVTSWDSHGTGNTWKDNVWDDTGRAVQP
jgi:hypothetical protein